MCIEGDQCLNGKRAGDVLCETQKSGSFPFLYVGANLGSQVDPAGVHLLGYSDGGECKHTIVTRGGPPTKEC